MKKFLTQELGESRGTAVLARAEALAKELRTQLPAGQSRTTRAVALRMLKVIALYKVLQQEVPDQAYPLVHKYQVEVVGSKNNRLFRRLEKLPGFFTLYRKIYLFVLRHTDMCGIRFGDNTAERFNFWVTRCLWLDTCRHYGCPELTTTWCHCDTAGFNGLKKLEFRRSVTLAEDGQPCDYCFVKRVQKD